MYCYSCGREITESGAKFCLFCGKELSGGTPQNSTISGCPWENMSKIGFVAAFAETLVKALLHPVLFFKSLSPKGKGKSVILYAMIVRSFGYVANTLWGIATDSFTGFNGVQSQWVVMMNHVAPLSVFFSPLIVFVLLILGTSCTHFFLMMTGCKKAGSAATLNASSYAMTAEILLVIPFAGGVISGIWMLVMEIIGIRELHRISTFRAVLALFLPFIILIIFVLLIVAGLFLLMPGLIRELTQSMLSFEV
jgi:hypothetical protein